MRREERREREERGRIREEREEKTFHAPGVSRVTVPSPPHRMGHGRMYWSAVRIAMSSSTLELYPAGAAAGCAW